MIILIVSWAWLVVCKNGPYAIHHIFQGDAGARLPAAGAAGDEPVRVRERAGAGRRGEHAQAGAGPARAAAHAALRLQAEGRHHGDHSDAFQTLQVTRSRGLGVGGRPVAPLVIFYE